MQGAHYSVAGAEFRHSRAEHAHNKRDGAGVAG